MYKLGDRVAFALGDGTIVGTVIGLGERVAIISGNVTFLKPAWQLMAVIE